MVNCCSSSECKTAHPNKHRCPGNGIEYPEVPERTISHHIKHPWLWDSKGRRYFFCDDPDCDIVYFSDDDAVIKKSQLRTKVGSKEASDDAMLCYCFGVTKSEALRDPSIRDFVITQTMLGFCSCGTSNPSGHCCLKNFPHDRDTERLRK